MTQLSEPGTWDSLNDYNDIASCDSEAVNHVDKDGKSYLYVASSANNIRMARIFLKHPETDVNRATINGSTPLHIATQRGYKTIVMLLLNSSLVNVNKANSEGKSPIHLSSISGYDDIVSLLLKHQKIDPNQVDNSYKTALMEASTWGHSKIVEILLSHPTIDVNLATWDGTTALFFASENGHVASVELLLRCPQTDTSIYDENGDTALEVAPMNIRDEMAYYISTRLSLMRKGHTCCSEQMRKGLQIAAKDGNEKMVETFLKCHGMDVNNGYGSGITPLYIASINNHSHVVELLLGVPNIDVNKIVNGETPLLIGATKGLNEIVKHLLENSQTDTNIDKNGNQGSALFLASQNGHIDIVKQLLLQPQIEVNNVYGPLGRTALFVSSVEGHMDVVNMLLRCPKTETDIEDAFGNIPREMGTPDAVQAIAMREQLLEIGATCCLNVNEVILKRAKAGDHRALRGLAQCPKANINIYNRRKQTPLYLASRMGHIHSVKALLSQTDIDPNMNNGVDGKVAFAIASEKGYFEIMKLFIFHGGWNAKKVWLSDEWPSMANEDSVKNATENIPIVPTVSTHYKGKVSYCILSLVIFSFIESKCIIHYIFK